MANSLAVQKISSGHHKPAHHGITRRVNVWIKNFLRHRQQTVVVDRYKLHPCRIGCATRLHPVLFLLYISYMPQKMDSNSRLPTTPFVTTLSSRMRIKPYSRVTLTSSVCGRADGTCTFTLPSTLIVPEKKSEKQCHLHGQAQLPNSSPHHANTLVL